MADRQANSGWKFWEGNREGDGENVRCWARKVFSTSTSTGLLSRPGANISVSAFAKYVCLGPCHAPFPFHRPSLLWDSKHSHFQTCFCGSLDLRRKLLWPCIAHKWKFFFYFARCWVLVKCCQSVLQMVMSKSQVEGRCFPGSFMLVAVQPKGQRSMGVSEIKAFVRQNRKTGLQN